MTIPIGWLTCSVCGVTQPAASLKDGKCVNVVKCAEWAKEAR